LVADKEADCSQKEPDREPPQGRKVVGIGSFSHSGVTAQLKALSAEIARRRGGTHPVRYLLALVAVALVYWAAARLSLNLALVHGQVTPIWPPTGIALV